MKDALKAWDDIVRRMRGKELFLFLDFDGTLAPIVRTPREAVLPSRTRSLLERLARRKGLTLAVISGRSMADVKKRVGVQGIIYAGCHGLEVKPSRIRHFFSAGTGFSRAIKQVKKELKKRMSGVPGVFLEDKGICLGVHYRLVKAADAPLFKKAFSGAVGPFLDEKNIKIKNGKKVFDIMPPVEWDKGRAVLWLLKAYASPRQLREAVYIGDDMTDEDAFLSLKGRGISIRVGMKKDTRADYYLKNTEQARVFLKKVEAFKRSDGPSY